MNGSKRKGTSDTSFVSSPCNVVVKADTNLMQTNTEDETRFRICCKRFTLLRVCSIEPNTTMSENFRHLLFARPQRNNSHWLIVRSRVIPTRFTSSSFSSSFLRQVDPSLRPYRPKPSLPGSPKGSTRTLLDHLLDSSSVSTHSSNSSQ